MSNKLYIEVMKLNKDAKKKAIEAMEYSNLLTAFVTEDGQIFTSDNLAKLHATDQKITWGGTTLLELKGLKAKSDERVKKETTKKETTKKETTKKETTGKDEGKDDGKDDDPIVVTSVDMKEARQLGVIDYNIN